jgi:DNA invertase Pin-like site-specific DNA recombinase
MKVALYARVSKALEQNPENQLIELRRWAVSCSHEIVGEYVDEVSSKDTRPNKEIVLRMLRLGEIDGVGFWSLDRWGRSMSELVLELEEFSKSGKSLVSMKEGIDLSTSAGRLMANILASMANFERDRIRERTLLGLARVRAQGKKLGRPTKDGTKYLDPHLEDVARLLVDGRSIREIASELSTSKHRVELALLKLRKRGSANPVRNQENNI